MRRLGGPLLLLGLLLALALGAPRLAQRWLGHRDIPSSALPKAATPLDGALERLLAGAEVEEEAPEARQDPQGAWEVRVLRARLPPGEEPASRAEAVRAGLEHEGGAVRVYTTPDGPWAVVLRVYDGKRPTHRVRLEARTVEGVDTRAAPWLALVFTGLGADPAEARALLEAPSPLTLAIRPYTPYALRLTQDALRAHKEVLVELPAGEDPQEAVRALLHPTGLLLGGPGQQLPARWLAQEGLYVAVDPEESGAPALRAARREGVRALSLPLLQGDTPEDQARRARALAAGAGVAALRVPAGDSALQAALLELLRGGRVRPVFATEALDRLSPP